MIVSTSTQSGSVRLAIVGFFSAGRSASTAFKSFFCAFIFSPTFSSASIAPLSSIARFSILSLFHGIIQLLRFAISCVVDSQIVHTSRSLFALKDEPVSVTSTIASTPIFAFTSVAPQLNSTSAFTLFFFRYFFVTLTSSVATDLPLKFFTLFILESSGTASTHLTGLIDCFA